MLRKASFCTETSADLTWHAEIRREIVINSDELQIKYQCDNFLTWRIILQRLSRVWKQWGWGLIFNLH